MIQVMLLLEDPLSWNAAVGLMEVGFSGASVAFYVVTTALVGTHSRNFRLLAFTSLIVVIGYRILLIVINNNQSVPRLETYRFQNMTLLFYFLFSVMGLYFTWQYRRKIRSNLLILGSTGFVLGQFIAFLNPEIPIVALSTNVSAIGALLIALGIIQREIIAPLAERNNQVEAIHRVSLAITSQLAIDTVLTEIVTQAARWLEADAAGVFLRQGDELELVNVYQLPRQLLHQRLKFGEGVSGQVVQTQKSVMLENYGRDWREKPDFALAKEMFGSVICVPLMYVQEVLGVLIVIAEKQGRLFNRDDVYLLERLGAQAAVAISHSRLFADERKLINAVEEARSQLETLLLSTENPVIAVDRGMKPIFINPSARKLFQIADDQQLIQPIQNVLPVEAFPLEPKKAFQEIKAHGTYVYEVSLENQVYLCHLAAFGKPRIEGWVAVMNDVTQLKELDRLKSEMVRMASHDLKNPLMGAMLYLDVLKDKAHPEMMDDVKVIERQLERMNRIIRGVLDLEQIRMGLKAFVVCDARGLGEVSVRDLQRLAHDKRIELSFICEETDIHSELKFKGDPDQIERALINLVENAIKFTASGGRVDVRLNLFDDDHLLYSIRDTGIGIPKPMFQQVFERFFRGQQKGVEHVTGSGLGLSIVKMIVENHHGRVWLESEEGQGTTFFVLLPRY